MEDGNESKLPDVLTDYFMNTLLISAHFIYLFIQLYSVDPNKAKEIIWIENPSVLYYYYYYYY